MIYQSYQNPYNINQPFPYIQASDYTTQVQIIKAFPHLKGINTRRQNTKSKVEGLVIRSANDDNAIKYGIWSTTSKNRVKMNQLYSRGRMENKQIYLFFSVVKSGMFEAVARLNSNFIEDTFPYWWDDFSMKFKGYFKIEWVYIKDVAYKYFDGLYNIQNEEVSKSKDCDIINNQTTQKMLMIFSNKPMKKKWIFNDFPYMDKRERQYTRRLQNQNNSSCMYPEYKNYNNHETLSSNHNSEKVVFHQSPVNFLHQMPYSSQMMKPITSQKDLPSYAELGFQMNPVSYKKKNK